MDGPGLDTLIRMAAELLAGKPPREAVPVGGAENAGSRADGLARTKNLTTTVAGTG
jgi:hypothetical protein